MESNIQDHYYKIDNNINELENTTNSIKKDLIDVKNIEIGKSESSLEIEDIIICIIAGFVGGAFSSSEKLENTLRNIHDNSSKTKKSKNFIEKLLSHSGDEIDKGGSFITRNGDDPEFGFHRLFFGHDPLSIKGDNPIILMLKQYGILSGTLQLFRHLIADTFSKQGLPLPAHSLLDYTKMNGNTGNYLVDLTKTLSKGADIGNLEAFNHLFSIRMQDILSQGLTWGIITSYIKVRGVEDKIKISQLKFSTYSISFFVNAVSGMTRTGGLPYMNWATFSMMFKEGITFFKLNNQEIKQLEIKTDNIVNKNIELEEKVFKTGQNIKTFNNADEYFINIKKEKDIFDDLTNFFEEV